MKAHTAVYIDQTIDIMIITIRPHRMLCITYVICHLYPTSFQILCRPRWKLQQTRPLCRWLPVFSLCSTL